ncbi:MAG: non-canonical purine NTP pyrophosphatase [bacterium]|nr:non-canonical purine NTP pyrophosphatase [bacterium]
MSASPLPLKVLLGTANRHKIEEIRQIWQPYPLQAEAIDPTKGWPDAPETGLTYLDNALQKAKFYFELTGMPCVADDSGLEIAVLQWQPGVHTKRFTPEGFSQEQRLQYMLERLKDFPQPEQRQARYRCTAVAYGFTETPIITEGVINGYIASIPAGHGGFGYDPIFHLLDREATLAQVSENVKNAVSHRGQAMRLIAAELLALSPHH